MEELSDHAQFLHAKKELKAKIERLKLNFNGKESVLAKIETMKRKFVDEKDLPSNLDSVVSELVQAKGECVKMLVEVEDVAPSGLTRYTVSADVFERCIQSWREGAPEHEHHRGQCVG